MGDGDSKNLVRLELQVPVDVLRVTQLKAKADGKDHLALINEYIVKGVRSNG